MDFATFAGCAGIALALIILPHLLFVVQIRGLVAEERRRRGEAAAQMLRSLEDSLAKRQQSPMKESPGTGHRHKLHKAYVCKPSPRLSCMTDKQYGHAASQRPRASSSTPGRAAVACTANASHKQRPAVGIGSFDMRSSKLASGCSEGAGRIPLMSIVEARASTRFSTSCGTLPYPPQVASGQVACPNTPVGAASSHAERAVWMRRTPTA